MQAAALSNAIGLMQTIAGDAIQQRLNSWKTYAYCYGNILGVPGSDPVDLEAFDKTMMVATVVSLGATKGGGSGPRFGEGLVFAEESFAMARVASASSAFEVQLGRILMTMAGPKKAEDTNSADTSWRSVKTFRHTFLKHGQGAKNTQSLKDTAQRKGQPQGQWLDNEAAAKLLNGFKNIRGPASMKIPEGMGQVMMPDGSILPTTRATMVPQPFGFVSAYPIP